MSTQQAESSPMTATERNTLIRITKQRFKLLHQGIGARTMQLERQIRDEIIKENEDRVEAARRRVAKVRDKMEKVYEEYQQVVTEEFENHGLTISSTAHKGRPYFRSFSDGPGQYLFRDFSPKDLTAQTQERLEKIVGDKPVTRYQLEVEEAQILESILVGNLKTGESRLFLDRIPTLESLIPLANGDAQKAIEA